MHMETSPSPKTSILGTHLKRSFPLVCSPAICLGKMGMPPGKINPWHTTLKAAKSGRDYDWNLSWFEFLWRAELTSITHGEHRGPLQLGGSCPYREQLTSFCVYSVLIQWALKKKKSFKTPPPKPSESTVNEKIDSNVFLCSCMKKKKVF